MSVFRRLRDISWCHFRRIWGLSLSSSSSFRGKFESNKARKKREKRDRHSLIAAALLPDFRVDAQEKKVNRSESDSNYGHKFFSAVLSGSQPASCEVFATANHCRVSCHLRDIHHQLCHCPDVAFIASLYAALLSEYHCTPDKTPCQSDEKSRVVAMRTHSFPSSPCCLPRVFL